MNQDELLKKELELSNVNLGKLEYIFTVYKEKEENKTFFTKRKEEDVSNTDKKKRYLAFRSNLQVLM
jgi:hypothetical protein